MRSESERQQRWLTDILDNILLAQNFTEGLGYEAFARDSMRLYATIRWLEIISEASRRLSTVIKERHPDIDWQDMASSGNVYRHEYRAVATTIVWSTLKNYLPRLKSAIEAELDNAGRHSGKTPRLT